MSSSTKSKRLAGLSRDTFLLALSSLFADVSTEMLYPVLPIFLTQTLMASGSVVGLIDGVAQATQNIVQGFSGTLADKLRRRKGVALAGYLIAAVAKPLMGATTSWQALFGARLLDRVGAGSRSAPRDALVASSVDDANRGRAFGLEGLGDNTGAFLGPLVAVFLLYSAHVDLRTIFYIALIPGLLAFCMVLLVREREQPVASSSKIDTSVGRLPRQYWRYLLAVALFALGASSNAFLILRTQEIGASLLLTIVIYAAFNLVAALISYPAGWLSDKFGRRNVLLGSFVIFGLTYLGFALVRSFWLIAVLFTLYGLYQGVFRAVGKALATDFVPVTLRASGLGWYSTTVGLFQLVASLITGLLWDRVGHAAVFYYGAVLSLLGSVALVLLVPKRH